MQCYDHGYDQVACQLGQGASSYTTDMLYFVFLTNCTAVFQIGPVYLGAQTALIKGGRTPKPRFRNI